ncbi:MAG TPA: signal peptidase II, partial [Anaerolineales bacterium]|nr:signal peptidase II [Anaerolineales bacterium]
MSLRYRVGLSVILFLFCTGFDRLSKHYAQRNLATAAPLSLLNDTLRIQYAENPGAMLGIGASMPDEIRFALFVVAVSAALGMLLAYAIGTHSMGKLQFVGLLLVGSGGVGNLVDRLTNKGAGIDFLNIGVGSLRSGIFNLADVFIVAG